MFRFTFPSRPAADRSPEPTHGDRLRAAARRFEDREQGALPPPDRRPRTWGDLSETEKFTEAHRRAALPRIFGKT